MAVCGHVTTALLCATQKGGLMNTGELCESIYLDEMLFHAACDLSLLAFPLATLFVALFNMPQLTQIIHHTDIR